MVSFTRPAPAISVPVRAAASSDESLIKRIAGGDKLAMQVLYARHHVRVFRFVLASRPRREHGGGPDQRGVSRRVASGWSV